MWRCICFDRDRGPIQNEAGHDIWLWFDQSGEGARRIARGLQALIDVAASLTASHYERRKRVGFGDLGGDPLGSSSATMRRAYTIAATALGIA